MIFFGSYVLKTTTRESSPLQPPLLRCSTAALQHCSTAALYHCNTAVRAIIENCWVEFLEGRSSLFIRDFLTWFRFAASATSGASSSASSATAAVSGPTKARRALTLSNFATWEAFRSSSFRTAALRSRSTTITRSSKNGPSWSMSKPLPGRNLNFWRDSIDSKG